MTIVGRTDCCHINRAAVDERKTPVYICSGKMYKLGEDGKLLNESHTAAAPYAWPLP
jgi:hypothetical protein